MEISLTGEFVFRYWGLIGYGKLKKRSFLRVTKV